MTWSEIQLESLKKMFLSNDVLDKNSLSIYRQDKKYKTYLDAMPQAYNEAVNYIVSYCGGFVEAYKVETSTMEKFNGKYLLDLFELDSNAKKIVKIFNLNGDIQFNMITTDTALIDYSGNDDILVLIEEEPTHFTSESLDTDKSNLPERLIRIVPLYIAGELYKDDDNSMATMYMNEFLSSLEVYAREMNLSIKPTFKTVYSINEV